MVRYAIEPYPSLVFGFGGRVNSAVREWVGLDPRERGTHRSVVTERRIGSAVYFVRVPLFCLRLARVE